MATSAEENMDQSCAEVVPAIISIPKRNISRIKNKIRRSEIFKEQKRELRKAKIKEKKEKTRRREALGDEAPPKEVPKTIESLRVPDETMVATQDDEVIADEAIDEMASYFRRERAPKVLITTSDRPRIKTYKLCKDLERIIPNSHYYYRKGLDLKKIIRQANFREFTDLMVINEDRKTPNGLVISHLPDGPTAHFKMSSVRLSNEVKNRGRMSEHRPEVILNNFNTRLGHSVGRMLASLFHFDPQFVGRCAVTFHNQRDYIFFRQHRYVFRNAKKVGLQELGPRFTLKLRSLQKGTFDSKFGEYEWMIKRHEMESNRRKFSL